MIGFTALALLIAAADAPAAPAQPTITVAGYGQVETPPDIATLSIEIRGEGKTPDAASADLARKQTAIVEGISSLSPDGVEIETGDVTMQVQRGPDCRSDDESSLVFSAGKCAIIGYVVSSSATVRMNSIKDAGTAVGLAGRLGAVKAEIRGFSLKSPGDAQKRATAQAFANARAQANVIATAGGLRLGQVLVVSDNPGALGVLNVSDALNNLPALRSTFSRPSPPPVTIGITPAPVTTSARIGVTFALEK